MNSHLYLKEQYNTLGCILNFTLIIFDNLFSKCETWFQLSSLYLFMYSFNPSYMSNFWTLLGCCLTYFLLKVFLIRPRKEGKTNGGKEERKEFDEFWHMSISVNFRPIKMHNISLISINCHALFQWTVQSLLWFLSA